MLQSALSDTEAAFLEWIRAQPDGRRVTFARVQAELALAPYDLIDCNEKMLGHLIREWAYKGDVREKVDGVRALPWIIRQRAV